MTKKRTKAQQTAVTLKRGEITEWYIANNRGQPPEHQCEDRKTYRGIVLWWLEPPIRGLTNPVLVEETLGDSWTLRIEPMAKCT